MRANVTRDHMESQENRWSSWKYLVHLCARADRSLMASPRGKTSPDFVNSTKEKSESSGGGRPGQGVTGNTQHPQSNSARRAANVSSNKRRGIQPRPAKMVRAGI